MTMTGLAQVWVKRRLREGDFAIDATVGNGHDTLFLARAVGANGGVFGFDVQSRALEAASARLKEAGLLERVTLMLESHAEMARALVGRERHRVRAVMFNLGYLPGGDKTLTTQTGVTLRALETALGFLENGGILTAVLYPGHPEGGREAEAVSAWAKALTPPINVTLCRRWNRGDTAPYLIVVEKP